MGMQALEPGQVCVPWHPLVLPPLACSPLRQGHLSQLLPRGYSLLDRYSFSLVCAEAGGSGSYGEFNLKTLDLGSIYIITWRAHL